MDAFFKGYYRILKFILTLLMGLIIIPVTLQILSRFIDDVPHYVWTEEVARFCFVWIIMIGAMIAVRDSTHFDVDLLPHPRTKRSKGVRDLIVHVAIAVMAGFFCYYGVGFFKLGYMQSSEMSGINMATIYVSFPLAGITWALFLIEKFIQDFQLIRSTETWEDSE